MQDRCRFFVLFFFSNLKFFYFKSLQFFFNVFVVETFLFLKVYNVIHTFFLIFLNNIHLFENSRAYQYWQITLCRIKLSATIRHRQGSPGVVR